VQLDNSCNLQPDAAAGNTADSGTPVTGMFRLIAALALFLEGLAGVYIPVLLRSVEGYEWCVCCAVPCCAALSLRLSFQNVNMNSAGLPLQLAPCVK
jgi:hypothetical protein